MNKLNILKILKTLKTLKTSTVMRYAIPSSIFLGFWSGWESEQMDIKRRELNSLTMHRENNITDPTSMNIKIMSWEKQINPYEINEINEINEYNTKLNKLNKFIDKIEGDLRYSTIITYTLYPLSILSFVGLNYISAHNIRMFLSTNLICLPSFVIAHVSGRIFHLIVTITKIKK
jgi:hypothetical protein